MASPTQWTCVWVDSGSWSWTGRPGVLRFMGSQRVRHDWAIELNWIFCNICSHFFHSHMQYKLFQPFECKLYKFFPFVPQNFSVWDFSGGSVVKSHLSMQETRVPSLVWEDPTCHRATKPMHHDYWACFRARQPQLLKPFCPRAHAPQQEKPQKWEIFSLKLEKSLDSSKDPAELKINKYNYFLKDFIFSKIKNISFINIKMTEIREVSIDARLLSNPQCAFKCGQLSQ